MIDLKQNGFHSPSRGKVTIGDIIDEISKFVQEDPKSFYRLVIGSDSQIKVVSGEKRTDFVTAIIIYRRGFGARYFWNRDKMQRAPLLREKIYTETQRSLNLAQDLVPELRKTLGNVKYDLEIHIDVGSVGQTREMIKEVVGMVNGNGYTARTKPESWGASSVADKYT